MTVDVVAEDAGLKDAAGRKIVAFPMFELWKHVGTPQRLDEAQAGGTGEISNV